MLGLMPCCFTASYCCVLLRHAYRLLRSWPVVMISFCEGCSPHQPLHGHGCPKPHGQLSPALSLLQVAAWQQPDLARPRTLQARRLVSITPLLHSRHASSCHRLHSSKCAVDFENVDGVNNCPISRSLFWKMFLQAEVGALRDGLLHLGQGLGMAGD